MLPPRLTTGRATLTSRARSTSHQEIPSARRQWNPTLQKNEAGTRKLALTGDTVGRAGHRGIPAAKYRKNPIDIIAADDVKKSSSPEMLPPRRNHARCK